MTVYHPGAKQKDKRYTVTKEFIGHLGAMYVARFCGDFIDCSDVRKAAWWMANIHAQNRQNSL